MPPGLPTPQSLSCERYTVKRVTELTINWSWQEDKNQTRLKISRNSLQSTRLFSFVEGPLTSEGSISEGPIISEGSISKGLIFEGFIFEGPISERLIFKGPAAKEIR